MKKQADEDDDWNEVASDGKAKETFSVESRSGHQTTSDANDPYKMAPKRPGMSSHQNK